MNRNRCPNQEDWSLFGLGVLEPGQRSEMQSHLDSGCGACRATQQEWAELLPLLSLAAPERRPSPEVEAKLERRILSHRGLNSTAESKLPARAIVWGLSLAAMLALTVHFAQQGRDLRRETESQRVEIARLRQLYEHSREAKKASATPPGESLVSHPKASALPSERALTVPEPAVSIPAPPASSSTEAFLAEKRIEELSAANAALGLRLSDAERSTQRLEKTLGDAEVRNTGLQQEAAKGSKLAEDVTRLRAEMRERSDARFEYDRLLKAIASGPLRSVELRRVDPGAGRAAARAIITERSGILVVVQGMPELEEGKCYQLWLIRKANPGIVSGGIIPVDPNGAAVFSVSQSDSAAGITGLAITDEPAGGSVSAKGHKLLFGAL